MKETVKGLVVDALKKLKIEADAVKIQIEYPEHKLGDYSSNAALILAKAAKLKPMDLAQKIVENLDQQMFEKVQIVKPGFINFTLRTENLLPPPPNLPHQGGGTTAAKLFKGSDFPPPRGEGLREGGDKILLEYFQPNIAKPLHVGHLRTAVIGDCLKRMLLYLGYLVESDTHMGDWGTQFGFLILACKKMPQVDINEAYVKLNEAAEKDSTTRDQAKQEFVKLEKGDEENRKFWKQLVEISVKKFMDFAKEFGLLPFENHWPESFYEDKMPDIVIKLKSKKLLKLSQGAQVVDLEDQGLGVAIIIKSDKGTTYLLRDLATFIFAKQKGFSKHLYVVDSRQSLHYKQLFAILRLMGEMEQGGGGRVEGEDKLRSPLSALHPEGVHINYGFISFKGQALSTRKGNMVLASDVIKEAEERAAKIIAEKNPDLANKSEVVGAVAKAALKYFDLKHNRHSDIEFDWEDALSFEGNSGPYLQYTHARLASILRRAKPTTYNLQPITLSEVEHRILFLSSILDEKVAEAMKDYLPNILANYLYELASEVNKFYHESPVLQEKDEELKNFRLTLVEKAKGTLAKGLDLLGVKALEEM